MSELAANARCRQLLRTVPAVRRQANAEGDEGGAGETADSPSLEETGRSIWTHKGQPEEGCQPLEAGADPAGGAVLVSHTWDAPQEWSKYFAAQSYADVKAMQVASALQYAALRGLPRPSPAAGCPAAAPRAWLDAVSVPDPMDKHDHPLDKVEYGPYLTTVREMKGLIVASPGGAGAGRYTLLHFGSAGHQFEGTMQVRTFDDRARPSKEAEARPVSWSIAGGWYYVRTTRVVSAERLSPAEAASLDVFDPDAEQLQAWCARLALKDDVWLEFSIGTTRAEMLKLARPMVGLHGALVAVVAWNYFDRLWSLCEWALFCSRCGPGRVQLAADCVSGPAAVEFHRALRRVSVESAECRDPRDRALLLSALEDEFGCEVECRTASFYKPAPGRLTEAVTDRLVDFTRVEAYVRATAVASFAREAALSGSRRRNCDDEAGFIELASVLGLTDLHRALKLCKPWDWDRVARHCTNSNEPASQESAGSKDSASGGLHEEDEPGGGKPDDVADDLYEQRVEAWWADEVLPALEAERLRASAPRV